MSPCARPGCPHYASGDEDLCTYDAKVRDGLITPGEDYERGWRRRPRATGRPREPYTTKASDVLTEEQRELASLMRRMGASERTIRAALQRRR